MKTELMVQASEGIQSLDHIKKQFQDVSDQLWSQHVCPALIFGRPLLVCSSCLAFSMDEDFSLIHPMAMVHNINKLCSENNITTQENLFTYFWNEAIKLAPSYGFLLMPRFTREHLQPTSSTSKQEESPSRWTQARIHILEQEVADLRADNFKLQAQLATVDCMEKMEMKELLKEVTNHNQMRVIASKHLEILRYLLNPEDHRFLNLQELPKKLP